MEGTCGDISDVIQTLSAAVETIMNPMATQAERQSAHQICENFKESSPHCIRCGLAMSSCNNSSFVRHFGLQLLEHVIRFRWNSLSQDEKNFLKSSAMELIAKGTKPILEEEVHIKDAVTRVCVELIKREWPQLWPSLLKDLYDTCHLGAAQTELVLKTYLRLVEDVITFQNVPAQRRREVLQGLTSSIADLFELFILLLQEHTTKANNLVKSGTEEDACLSQGHYRVSAAVLSTLTGYLDWVTINHIFCKNGLLIQILCLLLDNENLQLAAVECLLIIASRKGKVEDRKPLMILFSEDAMTLIWNAAVAAEQVSLNEYYYLFMKRLCQVLTELGKQLCAMWGVVPEVEQPSSFSKYLEALLALTQYPSQMVSSYTQTLWASFLKHDIISKDPVLLSFIPRLLQSATTTLMKVGYPTQNNSPSCQYARLDFDSDVEFNLFFSKYRTEVTETVRSMTMLQPKVAFQFACHWLQSVMEKPVNTGNGVENGNCKLASPSYIEWDAMTVCLECVMGRVLTSSEAGPHVKEGICILGNVLRYQTEDPLILSSLLSCISALFPFVNHTAETLPTVLEKIFSAVTFNLAGQTKSTRSRAVKNVRQHACSVLVKICKLYPDLLFPVFDQLYSHIQTISGDPEQLSQMEKCILTEALILISNKFNNFDKQSSFIEEVLKPVTELWLSNEFRAAFMSPAKFMSYIGLDQAPVEPSSADTCGINRSHISYCLHTILAVIKRCQWPQDPQVALQNGFVMGTSESGTPLYRNPATTHISLFLDNLLALIKTMNCCWQPEFLQLRHPGFNKAFELIESEKLTILGIPPPYVDNTGDASCKQPLERMQLFLTSTHDNSCHILGNAGQCLGYGFYTAPNLCESLLNTVFIQLDHLPDYRIKPVIRVFIKPFIQNCPKECYISAVIPLLSALCPYMYQTLQTKWQQINQRMSTQQDEENMESQEILDEQLARLVTREYLDLLVTICLSRKSSAVEQDTETIDEEMFALQQPQKEEFLSDLGQLCMKSEAIYPSISMCIFSGLSWNDSAACLKASSICLSSIKQMLLDKTLNNETALHFFYAVLCGLQQHGHHEAGQSRLLVLGLHMYEAIRPHFPDIRNVLLQIPNCTKEAVQSFDEKILQNNPQKQISDKKKKDLFKKLVADIIGKDIGQQFKREVHYKNLPPIFKIRPKNLSVDEIEADNIGICDLFNPSNGTEH